MKTQLSYMENTFGKEIAIDYAKRALQAYRSSARIRQLKQGRVVRHFCHDGIYRASFVRAVLYLRNYLKENKIECA